VIAMPCGSVIGVLMGLISLVGQLRFR